MTECQVCGEAADFEVTTTLEPITEKAKEYAGDNDTQQIAAVCLECMMKMGVAFDEIKEKPVCEDPSIQ